MLLYNYTPHEVVVLASGSRMVFAPTGKVARVAQISLSAQPVIANALEIECVESPIWAAVEDLPEQSEGVGYIVSGLVLARCVGRDDCFAPATGPSDGAVRNAKGQIEAVTKLVRAPRY